MNLNITSIKKSYTNTVTVNAKRLLLLIKMQLDVDSFFRALL